MHSWFTSRRGIASAVATALAVCASLAVAQQRLPAPSLERLPHVSPQPERIPTPRGNGSAFPDLPPHPNADQFDLLPPLDEELWLHGGSYLYAPEGDRLNWPHACDHGCHHEHYKMLRLPEDYCAPQPLTCFAEFLGADPIKSYPHLRWPGCDGYAMEPRLVVYGAYEVFALAFEQDETRQDGIGHQLVVDVDFRLTGTERIHLEFTPLGKDNSGGSFYQFNDPSGYIDNSTGVPELWWFEGEIASIFGGWFDDPFIPRDYHVTLGKYPLVLHNALLINDDIVGTIINKNNIYVGDLSNLNVQFILGIDDVNAYEESTGNLYGFNLLADYRHVFAEATYAFVEHPFDSTRSAHYTALSATKLFGSTTLAARALGKFGDSSGIGSGGLFVLESNYTRTWSHGPCGFGVFDKGVFYANAFAATEGWNSISGGGFDRLRVAFEVNPLVTISTQRAPDDTVGASFGVQLFGDHDNYFLIPEIAYEQPQGDSVFGVGLNWQHKTGKRSFFNATGVANFSDNPEFRRNGVLLSETIVF